MNKKIILSVIGLVVVGLIIGFGVNKGNIKVPVASAHEATIYREATCGCCGAYISYLKREGFEVIDNVLASVDGIKTQYGVPMDMASCHTVLIEGYVVEGHMPVEAINKLMSEHPEIKGIALPGMPAGSPGMGGAKRSNFEVMKLMMEAGASHELFMSL